MLKLIGALLVVAFVCALVLAVVYQKAAPIIEEQKRLLLERSLKSVLVAQRYEKQQVGLLKYYTAFDEQENILGWCVLVESRGYGGRIELIAGVNKGGFITGIKILEHQETPGLGSKVNEIEYKQTEPWFLKQFKNKKVNDLVLVKGKSDNNIQAITGATISSKAITDGLRKTLDEFLAQIKQ